MANVLYTDKQKMMDIFEKICFLYCIMSFLVAVLAFVGWTIPVWIQAMEFSGFLAASMMTVHCGFGRMLNVMMILCGILLIAIF